MTPGEFRKLALTLPETVEGRHMGHPDFRVAGKIFATLGPSPAGWGVVKLTPPQQHAVVRREPEVFAAVKGTWGERGYTTVNLKAATGASVRQVLHTAWCNTAPRTLVRAAESGDRPLSPARARTKRLPPPPSRTSRKR